MIPAPPDPGGGRTRRQFVFHERAAWPDARSRRLGLVTPQREYTMKIGILSKSYKRRAFEEVLDAMAADGFECFQFNAEIAGLPPMPENIPAGLPARVRAAAAARGLEIATFQGTFNMCHPDPEFRREGLRRLQGIAAACQALGTNVIAICTGTRDREDHYRYHPDNASPEACAT